MNTNIYIVVLFIGIVLYGAIPFLSNKDNFHSFLEKQGYTNIEYTGINYFSCGSGDVFKDGFKAVNMNGERVEGTICSGWFKGRTIRFD